MITSYGKHFKLFYQMKNKEMKTRLTFKIKDSFTFKYSDMYSNSSMPFL